MLSGLKSHCDCPLCLHDAILSMSGCRAGSLRNADVLEIKRLSGEHHRWVVNFIQAGRPVTPSICEAQSGTGNAMMQVDPGVDHGVFLRDVVHLFWWAAAGAAGTEELGAFAADGVKLEGAVGVEEVAAVLPDELGLDAFWFPCCCGQMQVQVGQYAGYRCKEGIEGRGVLTVRCDAVLGKLPVAITGETICLTRHRWCNKASCAWVEKALSYTTTRIMMISVLALSIDTC